MAAHKVGRGGGGGGSIMNRCTLVAKSNINFINIYLSQKCVCVGGGGEAQAPPAPLVPPPLLIIICSVPHCIHYIYACQYQIVVYMCCMFVMLMCHYAYSRPFYVY